MRKRVLEWSGELQTDRHRDKVQRNSLSKKKANPVALHDQCRQGQEGDIGRQECWEERVDGHVKGVGELNAVVGNGRDTTRRHQEPVGDQPEEGSDDEREEDKVACTRQR